MSRKTLEEMLRRKIASGPTLSEVSTEAKASSEKNRAYFFIHLGLLIYVLLVVGSTSDLQLLVPTLGIKLPLVDITLPLFAFYIIAPLVVLSIHFNYLQNLDSHHYKIMLWRRLNETEVPRFQIPAFLFDYAVLEKEGFWPSGLRWINRLLGLYLAPFTIAALLIRFSNYQSAYISTWHFVCFLVSLWVVRRVLRQFQIHEELIPIIGRQWNAAWAGRLFAYSLVSLVACITALTILISLQSADGLFAWYPSNWESERTIVPERQMKATLRKARAIVWHAVVPRLSTIGQERFYLPLESEQKTLAALDNVVDWSKWYKKFGTGIDLRSRSLRFASMEGAYLPRAQLSDARLEGAIFTRANLRGGSLKLANLQQANFSYAKLDGADLTVSDFRNAYFSDALLRGADLGSSEGEGSYLDGADLRGANLSGARLMAASMRSADLRGAVLNITDLTGSDISNSYFDGAYFFLVLISGAYLNSTRFPQIVVSNVSGNVLGGGAALFTNETRTGHEKWEDIEALSAEWASRTDVPLELSYLYRLKVAEREERMNVAKRARSAKLWSQQIKVVSADEAADEVVTEICRADKQEDGVKGGLAVLRRMRRTQATEDVAHPLHKFAKSVINRVCLSTGCLWLRKDALVASAIFCESP